MRNVASGGGAASPGPAGRLPGAVRAPRRRRQVSAISLWQRPDPGLQPGQLAFFAANAERALVSLKNILAQIDRLFSLGPAQPAATVVAVLKLAELAWVRVKRAVSLTLEADYPLPLWYRIETRLGEVHRDGSRLLYEAASEGVETLYVTAIGTDGHATCVEHTFTVSDGH
jgi:hypothetical protein